MVMPGIQKIFGRKASNALDAEQYSLPEGFKAKFKAYCDALIETGAVMPDRYSKTTPYICAFDRVHNSEAKKWITVEKSSLHLRYFDKSIDKNSGLAVLELDPAQQCYRIQKAHEYTTPEEALADFTVIISHYADPSFMRVFVEKLAASDVLDLAPYFAVKAEPEATIEAEDEPKSKKLPDFLIK